MKTLIVMVLTIAPSAAFACEATEYRHEVWGAEQTATATDEGWTVSFKDGPTVAFYSASVGTGIPYRALLPVEKNDEITGLSHRMIGDKLLIDMEVYEPHCP